MFIRASVCFWQFLNSGESYSSAWWASMTSEASQVKAKTHGGKLRTGGLLILAANLPMILTRPTAVEVDFQSFLQP